MIKNRRFKLKTAATGILLAAALALPVVSRMFKPAIAAAAEENYEDAGINRPESLEEGLSRKSKDEVRGRRVTIREPVMQVTDYDVGRSEAQCLGDYYYLSDENGNEIEGTRVVFEGDTETVAGQTPDPKYPRAGLPDCNNGKNKFFGDYEKYMLLHQAWDLNASAMDDAKTGKLKKHPAADGIYGRIDPSAKAVTKKIILDPRYRSPMTTGLYLAPGEVATVKVLGLKQGETLSLYTHHQDSLGYRGYDENGNDPGTMEKYFGYWDERIIEEARAAKEQGRDPDFEKLNIRLQGQWARQNQKVPCMGATFNITENGTFSIGCIYGGPLYVQPTSGPVEIEITGAVETPHFILGVTTVEEFENHLKNAPGLIATLDCENGQLIGPAEDMKNCDDIEMLGYFWHSVFALNSSFNGREYNYNVTLAYDLHVPAGEAVALSSSFAAQPLRWFKTCMNYEELTTKGNWGTFHELGHIQAKTYGVNWGMGDGEGEVWNNTLIVLMYSMLCNMDNRLIPVEHGEFVHPFTAVERSTKVATVKKDGAPITDYNQINSSAGEHFDQLSLYSVLIHSFGGPNFVSFFYTYGLNKKFCENKRADFAYRIALVNRVNIVAWLNENYHANIQTGDFTAEQQAFLKELPDFYPVAYRWANGIDGNETARKYEVDGRFQTVFDLSDGNIVCPKNYEIVEICSPVHGSVQTSEDKRRVVYTPPENVEEYDEFIIRVKVEGGRTVDLNVRFKLLYNGAYSEVWRLPEDLGNGKATVSQAKEFAQNTSPVRTEESSAPGKNDFRAGTNEKEYYRICFKFRATETGRHTFYLKADDASEAIFTKTDENGEILGKLFTASDKPDYSTNGTVTAELNEGDTVYIEGHLVNWGGLGYLKIGVKFPGKTEITDVPAKNIMNAGASAADLEQAEKFEGWQPKFFVSVKEADMTQPSDKSGWEVLKAPIPHLYQDGTDNSPSNLLDGNENTIYHTNYANTDKTPIPHEYVFDAGCVQTFNYFDVCRRASNGNSALGHIVLYAAKDGISENGEGEFGIPLFDGDVPAATVRHHIEFPDTEARYFKIKVTPAGGQNFTVLSEVYAGWKIKVEQSVKPSNFSNESSGFTENSANGKLSAEHENAYFEFNFLGGGFSVFSDTAPSYGSADVYIDGIKTGSIDLDGERALNKCVFATGGLETANHTARIVLTSEKPFNIGFISVDYSVPVESGDYPSEGDDYGDESVPRQFPAEWKSRITDFKSVTDIKFVKTAPEGYSDSYLRFDTYIRVYRCDEDKTKIAFVYPGTIISPRDCGNLFGGCAALQSASFENFDTSAMTGAISMFGGCQSLENINLTGFDTRNARWMGAMFRGCDSLVSLDLSGFKLAEGANIERMFENCSGLKQIVLPESVAEGLEIKLPAYFDDSADESVTNVFTHEKAGHTLTLHTVHRYRTVDEVKPTCVEAGIKSHEQCPCGHARLDGRDVGESDLIIPAFGHSEEILRGHASTCKEHGLTDGKQCSICGEILEQQQELPLAEHVWGEWHTVKEPTATENGVRERVCSEGHAETEIIAATGPAAKPLSPVLGTVLGVVCGGAVLASGTAVIIIMLKKRRK